MRHGRQKPQGGRRSPGRALRGLATLLVVVALGVVSSGVGVAVAKGSSRSGPVLATLKVLAPGVEVKVKGAVGFVAGRDGQALGQGDALRTDATGKAEIAYSDGSRTRLGTSTEFSIAKLTDKRGVRRTQGSLTVGSTWNRAAKVSESGEFSIKAGGATAAVEGTAFVVSCPSVGSGSSACSVTAIVDTVSVNSDDWTVTSATNIH